MSRKWIAAILTYEEASTQVEIVFTDAHVEEGFFDLAAARAGALAAPTVYDGIRPSLLEVSDNVPQASAGLPRECIAICRTNTRICWRSPTRPCRASSSPSSASCGIGFASTPGSGM